MINASAWHFLFQNLTTGVVFQDNSGAITQVNSAAERVLGLTEDQMKGKTSVDPDWRSIRENGDPFPGDEHPAMVALRTGKPVENVIMGVYQPEKKQVVWININSIPYFDKHKSEPSGVFSTFEDITEKKKTQEELIHSHKELTEKSKSLEALFNSQSTYVLKTDLHGFVTYANPAYVKMFFSNKEKQGILGSYGMDSIMPYHHDRVREVVSLCITHPGKSFQVEIDKPGPDGLARTSLWDFIAMVDEKSYPTEILCTGIDVYELKKAQSELVRSEEKYRSLVEESDNLILVIDRQGTLQYCNKRVADLVGLKQEAIPDLKLKITDFYHSPEQLEEFEVDMNRLFTEGKPYSKVIELQIGSRSLWIKGTATPIFNDKNKVTEAHVTGVDVTELRIKEEQLLTSEKRYRFLIESMDAVVVVFDPEGNYILVNEKGTRLAGRDKTFFEGKNLDIYFSPEEAQLVKNRIKEVLANNRVSTIERSTTINGKEFWFRSVIQPIEDISGERMNVLYISYDVTDQKTAQSKIQESESKYRSLIESSDGIIAMFDLDGYVLFANEVAGQLVGLNPTEAIAMKFKLHDIFPKDRKREVENDIQTIVKTRKGINEEVHVELGGKQMYFKSSLQPVFNEKDEVYAVLLNATDITEQKEAELRIKKSEANFKTLFNDSPQAYMILQDGVFIECNKASELLLEASREELIGISPIKISPEFQPNGGRSDELAKEQIEKALKNGNNQFEWMHIKLNGQPFLAEIRLFVTNLEGKTSLLVLWRDITLEKENQLKIQQSEANFRNLFFDSPQAYVIIQDGIFVDCNHASELLMESTREELIGISPDEISPEFQPNGRRSNEMAMEYIGNAIRLGHFEFEWTHIRPNGKEFLAEINLKMSEYNGNPSVLVLWRDITDEKRTQKVVQQLSQIVNQSPVSIIMTDPNGSIEYINKATTTNLGYSFEEVKGLNPKIWKSGETELEEYEQLWETVLSGKKWRGEFLKKRKDGELVYESSTVFPIFDSNQTITNLVAIQEDITERKKAEADLRLFQTVFESAVNGRLITDLDGNIIYCNQYYADMHHASKDEIIGSNCLEQVSDVSLFQYQIIRKRLLQTGTISAVEIEHKRKDGHTFPGLVNSSVIRDEKGKDKYISITILDISDRKQIENEIIELNLKLEEKVKDRTLELQSAMNRLETFFEVSLDMLCIADQNGRFIKLSKAFEDVLHYTRKDLEGQEFLNYIHPEDIQPTIEVMQTLQAQNKVISFVNRYRTAEGDYRFIEWYSSPVGEYVYAVARDITDRKEREMELINARKIAEEANASKSVFLSRMSHELRTPMNSILGFAQLLEMSDMNEMQESSVQHILHSGKHLLGLINEVLDIARIETGKISLSIEQVNVTASLNEVCALLEPLSQREAVDIVLGESFSKNLYIRADQQRTVQIMTNLINNAIKYNRKGGKVFIEQSLVKGSKGQEMVHISIKDTGIGIKQEDIGRLFTPFERIGAQNTEIEGTGLGLAVVKELVAVLGGELGVNSVVNEGSEFWIDLPKCDLEDVHTHEEIDDELMKMEKNSNAATILYVEDNAMNISLVEDIFQIKRPGYHLLTTTMGSEAVELAMEHRPRLILLDLDLPDVHGSLVLKQLKENEVTKGIPVVVVSADATKDQIKNLMSGGAERYITKPFDIPEFLTVVDMYIEN